MIEDDQKLAAWARNWHWNDCAEDKPVDPSIYFRDLRMLKAFVATLTPPSRPVTAGAGECANCGAQTEFPLCDDCAVSPGVPKPTPPAAAADICPDCARRADYPSGFICPRCRRTLEDPPAAAGREEIAKLIVPYGYGTFENQERQEDGSPWKYPPGTPNARAYELADAILALGPAVSPQTRGADDDWKEDPSADERWNAGLDFAMRQLCKALDVDPERVTWDAATETVDGDVQAVMWNILRTRFGEDWDPDAAPVADRAAVIEECAKVADGQSTLLWSTATRLSPSLQAGNKAYSEVELHEQGGTVAETIAAAIRALAPKGAA